MSKAVLMSMHPKWCYKICKIIGIDFFGKTKYWKRLDLRKSTPKVVPFKAYIYCTKDAKLQLWVGKRYSYLDDRSHNAFDECVNGKVIGEFVCDYVLRHCEMSNADIAEEMSCVAREEIFEYSNGKEVFGWHISNLKIYDKPKELSSFYRKCEKMPCEGCEHLKYQRVNANEYDFECEFFNYNVPLTRPPQSWCYVEELKDI